MNARPDPIVLITAGVTGIVTSVTMPLLRPSRASGA